MSFDKERASRRAFLRAATAGAAGVALLTQEIGNAGAAPALRAALARSLSQNATPVAGGSLTATLATADISGFKTWQADTANESAAWSAVFDTLVEYDEQYQITGGLFESWKTDDAITWTFAVRKGVTWHDGQPLVAKHFTDYFDTVLKPDSGAGTAITSIFKGATYQAVDDHTVKLVLPQPNAALLDGLSANWLARTADFDNAKPIGTGPFTFVEWTRNQQVAYKKNPSYWKPGLPYLDTLTFKMVPDQTQAINLLTTGEVNAIASVDFPKVKSLSANSSVQMIQVPEQYRLAYHYLLTKTDAAPWDNPKVRQAVNFAVDRPAMLAATLGYGSVRSNPVAKGSWAFDPSAPAYDARNLDQAKQLMTAAGYTAGQTAFKTTLKYWKEWSQMPQIAQIVQANLADIGIEVDLQLLTINDWVDSVENKVSYEMALTALVPRWDPSDQIGNAYVSTDGAALKWKNDAFAKAYAAGAATADQAKRTQAYAQCQQIALTDCPGTVLNEAPFFAAASSKVQGMIEHNRAFQLFYKAWLSS
jgi:peptide/nickel transport system substrate-binding protein